MLKLSNINTYYGPSHVLRDVALEVQQGEIVTLLGANAAGKTTTMKTILGIVRPTSGEITFDGKRIERAQTTEIVSQGLALVPEARRVFPRMTVFENLQMGAYTRSNAAEIQADLERVYKLFPRLKE